MIKISTETFMVKASLRYSFYFISEGSYGGDQTWYVKIYPKGKKGEIQNRYGCGPASVSNITAFYAKYYPSFKNLYSESSWDILNYIMHMNKLFSYSPERPIILPDYTKMMKNYAKDCGIELYAHSASSYGFYFNSCFKNICNNIKNGIAHNAPVALLIGPVIWKGRGIFDSYSPSDILSEGNVENINNFKTHWVTITEYDFEKENYAKVTVSSWGCRYVLNLSALMDQRLFLDIVWFTGSSYSDTDPI